MRADLERQRRRIAGEEVMLQCGLHHDGERAQRGGCGDRVGGVGRDQQRRMIATAQRALEAARDFDPEQHLARLEETTKRWSARRVCKSLTLLPC